MPVLCISLWGQEGTSGSLRLSLTSSYLCCCWEETCPGSPEEATDAAEWSEKIFVMFYWPAFSYKGGYKLFPENTLAQAMEDFR